MYSFSYLEPVCCSMSSSNCCFLSCIQISQNTVKVVLYCDIFKNFPQFVMVYKDGEALYSQQKQDRELTVAQIMNTLLPSSDLN